MNADEDIVRISAAQLAALLAELERLRALEAELPALLTRIRAERDAEKLVELHQRDKDDPESARQRARNRYRLKRDEINAKRREAYKRRNATPVPPLSDEA